MNEGTSTAFVTCSLPGGNTEGSPAAPTVAVYVINRGAANRSVTCTLVDGFEDISGPIPTTSYIPKTAEMAGGSSHYFIWTASELPNDNEFIYAPNFSCQLPQGTGLAYLFFTYEEDVGQ
jgi:hypothetical protein